MSDLLPPPSAAAPDLICWLYAAFPASDGRLSTARIADGLGVSRRTVQRWVADPKRSLDPALARRLRQRAILRGRGTYLWPGIDDTTRRRNAGELDYARRVQRLVSAHPKSISKEWVAKGYMEPRRVLLVHYPKAHVYAVTMARTPNSLAKITSRGEVIAVRHAPNIFAAQVIKGTALADHFDHRVIAPRELVPMGRTDVWSERDETKGLPQLTRAMTRPTPARDDGSGA